MRYLLVKTGMAIFRSPKSQKRMDSSSFHCLITPDSAVCNHLYSTHTALTVSMNRLYRLENRYISSPSADFQLIKSNATPRRFRFCVGFVVSYIFDMPSKTGLHRRQSTVNGNATRIHGNNPIYAAFTA